MTTSLGQIKVHYETAFEVLNEQRPVPEIDVRYYPYLGINHTIRVRSGKVFVRIAEICVDAPSEVHFSLAFILVSKLLGRRISPQAAKPYREFVKTDELHDKAAADKRTRGRKRITTSKGAVYDLDVVFERLNLLYFGNTIPKPTLSWSSGKTFRILGHHDAAHETIIVSKSLDESSVPEFVVEYVVFHEMLHVLHPIRRRGGRRFIHTPEFKRDERKFAYYDDAEGWIKKNVGKLKRKAAR